MTTEIFMEGVQLDISADVAALFTYAIDDVRDFGGKNTNYSKTIVLPGSGRNNAIFGHVFEFTAYNPYDSTAANIGLNFNAAKRAQCIVLLDGIQIFKGVLRLMEAVQAGEFRSYECAVFGELGGLMAAIGSRLLTANNNPADDLDFSAYNAAWTTGNMTTSWQNLTIFGGGSGLYWPLINYGNVTANQVDYQYKALRPAMYLKEYLDKIITKAGYTYDSAFFSTAFFKRCIIPHNEDQVYKLVNTLLNYRDTAGQASFLHSLFGGGGQVLSAAIKFPTAVTGPYGFTVAGTGNTSFTYTPATSILAKVTIQLYLQWGGGENLVDYSTKIKVNGTVIQTASFTLNGNNTYSVGSVTMPHSGYQTILVQNLVLNQNDVITVDGVATILGTLSGQWEVRVASGSASYIQVDAYSQQQVAASYGDTIPVNGCIPKGVLQSDLLISVTKMFNLYITEDKFKSKHLNIVPYVDFYDVGNPEDWSDKLDRSKEMRLKPMSELNARYFNFTYDKDSDFYNDTYNKRHGVGYADRTYDVGLDFVEQKKDLKIVFAPSPLVGYVGKDKYVTAIYKIENGAEVATSSKIRILQAKVPGSVASWNILDGATIRATRTDYPYAGHVDNPVNPTGADLNFGAPPEIFWTPPVAYTAPNLFNAFYSPYMAEITDKDSKLLTCYVRLNAVDIYNLDWTRPKLIDGQLWRLNKIVDYDAVEEGVTKCELLKIINLSY